MLFSRPRGADSGRELFTGSVFRVDVWPCGGKSSLKAAGFSGVFESGRKILGFQAVEAYDSGIYQESFYRYEGI